MKSIVVDITGLVFGRLTVLKRANNIDKNAGWLCQCSCGKRPVIKGTNLRSGNSKSCGCRRGESSRERISNLNDINDGRTKHPLYATYRNMIRRCEKVTDPSYKNYGGRGIKVCPEWRNDFWQFAADMGKKIDNELTVERVNNDGNYEKSNCIWASRKVNLKNRRKRVHK